MARRHSRSVRQFFLMTLGHGPIYEVDLESQPLCVLNLRQSMTFAPTAKGLQRGALALRSANPRENLEALLKKVRKDPIILS